MTEKQDHGFVSVKIQRRIIGCFSRRKKKKRLYLPPGKFTVPPVIVPLRLRLLVITERIQPFLITVYQNHIKNTGQND